MISLPNTFRFAALGLLAASAAQGCMASQADIDAAEAQEQGEQAGQAEVAGTEQALLRGGNNTIKLGYSCSGGTCECSKAIENDCEDMTAVCTDATVDGVITCINGWLTTHCTCTQDTSLTVVSPTKTSTLTSASTSFSLRR